MVLQNPDDLLFRSSVYRLFFIPVLSFRLRENSSFPWLTFPEEVKIFSIWALHLRLLSARCLPQQTNLSVLSRQFERLGIGAGVGLRDRALEVSWSSIP